MTAVAAVAVTFLALETATRGYRAIDGPRPTKQDLGKHFDYDPLLGWNKRPGFRMRFHQWEYTVDLTTNSHGLRDPERGYEPAPGTFRILALGDSFVEAYAVNLENSVTQVLEADLKRDGGPVEVLNGGTAGYSTDQEYLFFESEGLRYSPQVVLLFFYYNDVLYNNQNRAFSRPKPLLVTREDGSLQPNRYPVRRLSHEAHDPEEGPPSDPYGSAFLGWLQDRLRFGNRSLYNHFSWLWPPLPLQKGVPLEMRVYESRPPEPIEESWNRTRVIMDGLAEECRRRGLRLLIVYVPSRMEVDDATWERTKALYGMDEGWDRLCVARKLVEIAKDRSVPFLDLTPPLREAGPASYYRIDEHWTALGNRVAGDAVARDLKARRWLQDRGSPPPSGP